MIPLFNSQMYLGDALKLYHISGSSQECCSRTYLSNLHKCPSAYSCKHWDVYQPYFEVNANRSTSKPTDTKEAM